MGKTVIGFFKHESDAQKAVQRLEELGIGRDYVDVTRGSENVQSTNASLDADRDSRHDDNAITRFFKNLFGDDDDADRYSTIGRKGYSIVTVHAATASDAERAADVLDDCGAADVDETYAQYNNDANQSRNTRDTDRKVEIPRIKEELQVGKRSVESGGVRVRSRIIEKPVEESVRLREEHIRVDRQPANRPVTDADNAAFEDQDLEFTERREIPVVNKEARVVEEVKISKDVTERDETVRDTVRNTELDIQNDRRNISDNETGRNDLRRDMPVSGNTSDDIDDVDDYDNNQNRRDADSRNVGNSTLRKGRLSDDDDNINLRGSDGHVNLRGDDGPVNLK